MNNRDADDRHADDGFYQAIAQFDEVGNEGFFDWRFFGRH
jgi:hypothetical protein